MRVGFIGAGKVGCSCGKMLFDAGVEISGYFSSDGAADGARATNSVVFDSVRDIAEKSDILFFTVPDSLIKSVWESAVCCMSGKIACHMSGAMSAKEAFVGAEDTRICSIHPMTAVAGKEEQDALKNAFFTAEGSGAGEIKTLFERAGCRVLALGEINKPLYHAASVFSANLVNALVSMSVDMLKRCGFDEKEALEALKNLGVHNMQNIFALGLEKSMTGPVERNDIQTIKKHLAVLDEDERAVYTLLSLQLVETAKKKHPENDMSAVAEALKEAKP